jgi:hypothetical protein
LFLFREAIGEVSGRACQILLHDKPAAAAVWMRGKTESVNSKVGRFISLQNSSLI